VWRSARVPEGATTEERVVDCPRQALADVVVLLDANQWRKTNCRETTVGKVSGCSGFVGWSARETTLVMRGGVKSDRLHSLVEWVV